MLSRHHPLALLASVVLAQVLLLAFQIKRSHDVRLIRYWAAELLTPAERAGTWSFSKVGGIWTGYVDLHGARGENQRLHGEVDRLLLRNRELETQAAETRRLEALLNFRENHNEAPMLAAQVIGASADSFSQTLYINRGERDHVRRNQAVITPEGVVGKIVEVQPTTAVVQTIDDRESGIGVLLADTRTHGVVLGTGDPEPRMEYVVNDNKVYAGEEILTSGEDRIFPKGLLVGTVAAASPGNPFQKIKVQPAARLDRLEDVMVLLSQQELTPKNSGDSSARDGVVATPPPTPQPAPKPGTALPKALIPNSPSAPGSDKPVSKAPKAPSGGTAIPSPHSGPAAKPPAAQP